MRTYYWIGTEFQLGNILKVLEARHGGMPVLGESEAGGSLEFRNLGLAWATQQDPIFKNKSYGNGQ